jgi:hypothetical protein
MRWAAVTVRTEVGRAAAVSNCRSLARRCAARRLPRLGRGSLVPGSERQRQPTATGAPIQGAALRPSAHCRGAGTPMPRRLPASRPPRIHAPARRASRGADAEESAPRTATPPGTRLRARGLAADPRRIHRFACVGGCGFLGDRLLARDARDAKTLAWARRELAAGRVLRPDDAPCGGARVGAGSTRGRGDGTAAGAALRQGVAGGSDRGGSSMRRTLPA